MKSQDDCVVYEDEGSVEGLLERKVNAHGQFEFIVYDTLDNHPIKCEVEEIPFNEITIGVHLGKRVEVLGKVGSRKDGLPVSVKVRKIISFPSVNEIPSVDEMRRLIS